MSLESTSLELPPQLRPPVVVERPEGSGVYVRLNDSYLRSIVYLGCAKPGSDYEIDPNGTGFLMSHEGHTYIVTAAHVAVDFVDGAMAVRLNKKDELGGLDHVEHTNWIFHSDDKIDVAVMPYEIPAWAVASPLKSQWVASEFKIATKDFGVGDLAYVVGIFKKMRGTYRNIPFVHTGNVASMHGERVWTDDWRRGAKKGALLQVEGHLIQATTLSESSGSPVFVRRSLVPAAFMSELNPTTGEPSDPIKSWMYGTVWLLGLWHGNWETKDAKKGTIVGDDMGLCIPAPRILEVLNRSEVKAIREQKQEDERQGVKISQQKSESAVKVRDGMLGAMLDTPPQPRTPRGGKQVRRK